MTSESTPLSSETQAVRVARENLGRDLDSLNDELERQIGQTMEKMAWKAATAGAAIVSGLAIRKVIEVIWKKSHRGSGPPHHPASPQTAWSDAIIWTFATAAGMAVARLMAERGAAAGWQKATGHLPPGLED